MLTKVIFCMKNNYKNLSKKVIIYAFENLQVWLKDSSILNLLLHFNLLQCIVLLEVHKEDPASQRYVVRKKEEYFKKPFRKLWVFFNITQKLHSGSFLKVVSCNIVSEIMLMNLDIFPYVWFWICIHHLRNTGPMNYADLLHVVTLH